jgi:hypothetical protein
MSDDHQRASPWIDGRSGTIWGNQDERFALAPEGLSYCTATVFSPVQ